MDPAEFARRNAERGVTKQYEPSALDAAISRFRGRRGSARATSTSLHPGLMYRLFTLYWSGQRAMGFVDAHLRFARDGGAADRSIRRCCRANTLR